MVTMMMMVLMMMMVGGLPCVQARRDPIPSPPSS
jgi:hypothetical protein